MANVYVPVSTANEMGSLSRDDQNLKEFLDWLVMMAKERTKRGGAIPIEAVVGETEFDHGRATSASMLTELLLAGHLHTNHGGPDVTRCQDGVDYIGE